MAEFTAVAVQNVGINQNVLFTEVPVSGCSCSILHREGSGLVTLRGNTKQCRALYRVTFGANIAIPATGTVTPISITIAINGEPLASSIATVTPGVVSQFNNVFSTAFISVPCGCCSQISIENVSTQAIDVQNANLMVERVA